MNMLPGPKSVEMKSEATDMVDSSESSYGELIQKKVRFFSPNKVSPSVVDDR